jgi:hypothetical protein
MGLGFELINLIEPRAKKKHVACSALLRKPPGHAGEKSASPRLADRTPSRFKTIMQSTLDWSKTIRRIDLT